MSSARVVRCWVKPRNERNPCCQLPARKGGDSGKTAGDNSEEGGDDVKSSCPLCLGLHTCYNGCNKGKRPRKGKRISEKQSQFGLWAATRPHEVGVVSIADQHAAVNTFPGLVHTARHTMGVESARSRYPNLQRREPSKVRSMTGVKS